MIAAICRRRTEKQVRTRTIWKSKMLFDADLEAIGIFNDPQPVRRLRISAGRGGGQQPDGKGGQRLQDAGNNKEIQRGRRAGSAALWT